jgi:hypothetical protein
MLILSKTFLRAFGIVCCTSANVVFIARADLPYAFVTGFLISFLWWHNARTAAHASGRWAGCVYGLGAATGTATGMILARLL